MLLNNLANEVRDELLEAKAWDRYDNPFEQKWVLQQSSYTGHMWALIEHLQAKVAAWPDCAVDKNNHFTAYFKYDVGDYLDMHYDAGVCPFSGKRKAVTVLLYLSTSDVQGGGFYLRDKWVTGAGFGAAVQFENDDSAVHGNPDPVINGTRLVATVSFLKNDHSGYTNMRKRAYFVPRNGEAWSSEILKLRDLRASEEHFEEVYAIGR